MSLDIVYVSKNFVFDSVKRFPHAEFTTAGSVTGSCP